MSFSQVKKEKEKTITTRAKAFWCCSFGGGLSVQISQNVLRVDSLLFHSKCSNFPEYETFS